ncbi:hypothetical protein Emed_002088 [Eimeria media]
MAVSRLLFCAASLAVLDLKIFANASENELTFGQDEVENCLDSLNAARGAAGLVSLAEGADVLIDLDYKNDLGKDICDVLEVCLGTNLCVVESMSRFTLGCESKLRGDGRSCNERLLYFCCISQGKQFTALTADFSRGTFATFGLTDDEKAKVDCSAAVQSWQSGFSIFGQTAPSNDKIEEYIKDPKALAFLTLYNPLGKNGECKVATCTPAAPNAEKKKYGLVCLTSPNVLGNQSPMFTADQWEKIAKIFSSSASAAVPSFLAIAAVLAGVSLM